MKPITRLLAPTLMVGALFFAGASCSSGGSSTASFCSTMKKWKDSDAFNSNSSSQPGSKEFEANMKKAQQAVDEMKSSAPTEIKGDVTTLADAVDTIANLDYTDQAAVAKASSKLDQKKIDAATKNISKYTKDECKIDLGS